MSKIFTIVFIASLSVFLFLNKKPALRWYIDSDQDGYGNQHATPINSREKPGQDYTLDHSDCDDSDPAINRDHFDINDGKDNNCDGFIDGKGIIYKKGDIGPAGGIVFRTTNDGRRGFEFSPEDIGGKHIHWGCSGKEINGAYRLNEDEGQQNTQDIIYTNCQSEDSSIIAAKVAADYSLNGYSDWFLPSRNELAYLCLSSKARLHLEDSIYWSSSQVDKDFAWACKIDRKEGYRTFKVTKSPNKRERRVRAIRAFDAR